MDNSGFFFHHQHPQFMSSNLNSLGFPFDIDGLNMEPVSRNPFPYESPKTRTKLSLPFSGMKQFKAREPNGSQSSKPLYSHLYPACSSVVNFLSKEKSPGGTFDLGQKRKSVIDAPPDQKKFLVFDHSGGKTNLVYSSMGETFGQGETFLKIPSFCYSVKELPKTGLHPLRPIMNDELVEEDSLHRMEDGMRENTEELNALLCSDSDDDLSEDDETSTGHSPSVITHKYAQNETDEEADNFGWQTKRRKLLEVRHDAQSQRQSRIPSKINPFSVVEDEAESTCGNKQSEQELSISANGKRNEQIRKTVSILRSIFPSVNSEDAIAVIDEAIHCLKSLKFKIEEFGLETL